MSSEIILLRRPDGTVRYTGWFRTLARQARVLYAGFYMVEQAPNEAGPSVKVVFPMPRGNATVILRPALRPDGSLVLDSSGRRFGDAGFYRLVARGADRIRVWHVRSLKELFHVYVDAQGVLRCDHTVRFLGLPVLRLHYKMFRANAVDVLDPVMRPVITVDVHADAPAVPPGRLPERRAADRRRPDRTSTRNHAVDGANLLVWLERRARTGASATPRILRSRSCGRSATAWSS